MRSDLLLSNVQLTRNSWQVKNCRLVPNHYLIVVRRFRSQRIGKSCNSFWHGMIEKTLPIQESLSDLQKKPREIVIEGNVNPQLKSDLYRIFESVLRHLGEM